ncbi:MAG TPA: pre-peptidase C-terminal domain-containing protein, partial [Chitinophagales bacterium]|nr:pre-peptidase C-terminal domain-containing protein [Chitinophagales bacterium]
MKHLLLKNFAVALVLLLAGNLYSATESEPNDTYETSNVANLGSANTGSAGYSYDLDWWEITIPENGNLTITSAPSSATSLWCYLYDNNGTTLLASSYSSASFNVSRNDLQAGTYYIRINCYYSGDSTDYTFTPTFTAPSVEPDLEPNDYFPIANTLGLNDSTTGNVGYYINLDRDSTDWYEVTTVEDGPLYIYLNPLNGSQTWIYLYDTDGTTLLASGYGDSAFSIDRQDLAAGTYHILVKMYYTNGYTPYTLKNTSFPVTYENDEESNDIAANAVSISENSTIEGHIGYYTNGARDLDDWYEITTTEDGILNFSLTGELSQLTYMYIYDTDGTTSLVSNYSAEPFSISRNDLAVGTYYLRVRMYYGNGYNNYSITNTLTPPAEANDSEPNNAAGSAITIAANSTIEGHIGYYTDGARDLDDWYEITTTEDGNLTFSLTGSLAQLTYMYIYDTDGTTSLVSNYNAGPFSISRNDLAAGTYYLRVRMYYGDGYNSYSITNTLTPPEQENDPEPNNSVATASPIETNVTVDGHIGYYNSGVRDQYDYYAITLS